MNKKEAQELLDRYAANLCSPEEKAIVERWYARESGVQQLPEVKDLKGTKDELWEGVLEQTGLAVPKRRTLSWVWISSAAAVFILVGLALYFYIPVPVSTAPTGRQLAAEILPGSDKAVLTLADGSTILLADAKNGRLASEGYTSVNKTAEGQLQYEVMQEDQSVTGTLSYHTVSTPKGGQYHVILPDGTGVWLNALSSVKFPVAFTGKERNVEISGEVYFEVKANEKHPFIVKTGNTRIRVLGTHFNVMAYHDESSVKTTLLEGKVQVLTGKNVSTIAPGQQAAVLDGAIEVKDVDVEEAVAWIKGYFYFKDSDVKTVMRQISRWYDVDVEYKANTTGTLFSGKMYRKVNLSKVLDMLSYFKIDYQIIEGKVHKDKKTILIN